MQALNQQERILKERFEIITAHLNFFNKLDLNKARSDFIQNTKFNLSLYAFR